MVSWSLLCKQLKQVCAISVDLKLIAHKTWNERFYIFHFNKIGKIKGIDCTIIIGQNICRGHTITHNTCSK